MTQNIYDRLGTMQYSKVRVIQNLQSLSPGTCKSGVAIAELGEHYYVPDYNENDPKDKGLGLFVEIVDDPAAPIISVKRLRYMVAGDLNKTNSIGELLGLMYPQYIEERNYFDAVDKSVLALLHYQPDHVEALLNKAEQFYYFDLNWLTAQDLPERIKRLDVTIYDQSDAAKTRQPNQTEFKWDLLAEAAVLTITFVDNAKLRYVIYPTFDGLRTSTRLIRLESGTSPLNLYTDAHGNLHSIDFKKLIGDFLHFELDNLTAKYYVKYKRAGITPIGSGEGSNTPMQGFEFALSYIDPTNIPNVTQFINDIDVIVNGKQASDDDVLKPLTVESADGQDLRIEQAEPDEQDTQCVDDNQGSVRASD